MLKKIGVTCLGVLLSGPGYSREAETALIVSIDALHPDALSAKIAHTAKLAGE